MTVDLRILTSAGVEHIPLYLSCNEDEGPIAGEGRPADRRERLPMISKSFFLGHNGPVIAIPEVNIEDVAAEQGNILLFKSFAPTVRCLAGDELNEVFRFPRGQFVKDLALGYTPKLTIPKLHIEFRLLDLIHDLYKLIVVLHEATLRIAFSVVVHRSLDVSLIPHQFFSVHRVRVIVEFTPLVMREVVAGQLHIELQLMERRGEGGEAVLTHDKAQGTAIVPLYVKRPHVINELQGPQASSFNGSGIVRHAVEANTGAFGILLANERQHFSADMFHTHTPSISILISFFFSW